jgi:Tol biopolymer transport system component
LTRLTRHDAASFGPLWTLDGTRVIYQSERPQYDIYWRRADLSAPEQVVFSSANDKQSPAISPDGILAYAEYTPNPDIWLLPLDGSARPTRYLQTPFAERHPHFSPNGRWLAYESNESGRAEVYIQAYPDPALGRRQISTDGGTEPLWRADGRELYYRNGDEIVAVAIDPESGEPRRPQTLFTGTFAVAGDARSYDVSSDGQRFLLVKIPADAVPRTVNVVLNWFDELNAAAATGGNE